MTLYRPRLVCVHVSQSVRALTRIHHPSSILWDKAIQLQGCRYTHHDGMDSEMMRAAMRLHAYHADIELDGDGDGGPRVNLDGQAGRQAGSAGSAQASAGRTDGRRDLRATTASPLANSHTSISILPSR